MCKFHNFHFIDNSNIYFFDHVCEDGIHLNYDGVDMLSSNYSSYLKNVKLRGEEWHFEFLSNKYDFAQRADNKENSPFENKNNITKYSSLDSDPNRKILDGTPIPFNADTPKANNPGILEGTPNNHTHNEIEITPISFDLNETQAPKNTIQKDQ